MKGFLGACREGPKWGISGESLRWMGRGSSTVATLSSRRDTSLPPPPKQIPDRNVILSKFCCLAQTATLTEQLDEKLL